MGAVQKDKSGTLVLYQVPGLRAVAPCARQLRRWVRWLRPAHVTACLSPHDPAALLRWLQRDDDAEEVGAEVGAPR